MKALRAFSSIELLTVIGVALLLSAMAAPNILSTLRKARVSESADMLGQVVREARTLSLRGQVTSDYFGVVVGFDSSTRRNYAALTYGPVANVANILMDTVTGEPVLRYDFNANVVIFRDGNPMDGSNDFGWLHQYRTGNAVNVASVAAPPIGVGLPGSPLCESLVVRTLDGSIAYDVMVYPIGIPGMDELDVAVSTSPATGPSAAALIASLTP